MQYCVKKIARYGTSFYGPYRSYEAARAAQKALEKSSFDDESFFEIEPFNPEKHKIKE
jgi:hypothetical protein